MQQIKIAEKRSKKFRNLAANERNSKAPSENKGSKQQKKAKEKAKRATKWLISDK